jgi:hypothetical protein
MLRYRRIGVAGRSTIAAGLKSDLPGRADTKVTSHLLRRHGPLPQRRGESVALLLNLLGTALALVVAIHFHLYDHHILIVIS